MERVSFLIESTGERLSCMLNPETLEIKRLSGLRGLQSLSGMCAGSGGNEDPVFYAGGGRTELRLDLLFDTTLAGSTIQTEDVRDLTAPLWRLSERNENSGGLPLVRFIWGRSWNLPGVIVAVAERFDYFTPEGDPRRSWISLRFRRVNEPVSEPEAPDLTSDEAASLADAARENFEAPEAIGSISEPLEEVAEPPRSEPLYVVAERIYGDPSWWRFLAELNNVENPILPPPADLLQTPETPSIGGGGSATAP